MRRDLEELPVSAHASDDAELNAALKLGAKAVNNPDFIPYTASAASERIPNATL